jgi:hypothetical protein
MSLKENPTKPTHQCEGVNVCGNGASNPHGMRCHSTYTDLLGGHWLCWTHRSVYTLGMGTVVDIVTGRRRKLPEL